MPAVTTDAVILALIASVLSAGITGVISGAVLLTRIKVYLEWFRAEISRIDASVNRAHVRIDDIGKRK